MPPELRFCVPVPLKVTVPVPEVNVPELLQSPLVVIVGEPDNVTDAPLPIVMPAAIAKLTGPKRKNPTISPATRNTFLEDFFL